MEYITIGSFNLRNHYWDRNWNGIFEGHNFTKELAKFIKDNNVDFLGIQEITKKYAYNLYKELGEGYSINGDYRFKKSLFLGQFNEANFIITNQQVLKTETKKISIIPFFDHLTQWPRIMTKVTTSTHTIINTHIEYRYEYAQKHQLKLLYQYIKKCIEEGYPPIIVGDFNMDRNKDYFLTFIEELEKLEIYHIDNKIPTYVTKQQILDHIFIPNIYEIIDVKVIQNQSINTISDHRPILVKLRKKVNS